MIAFLCNSSICVCNCFPYCNRTKHWTGAKVCVVALSSSNFCYISGISVPSLYRFGSSCRVIHSSIVYLKIIMQPVTITSKVAMLSLMDTLCYSKIFGEVVGCNFNSSFEIFIWKSNVTRVISSFDSLMQ